MCLLALASTFTHFQSVFSLSVGIKAEAAGPDAKCAGLQEAITLISKINNDLRAG